MDLIKNKENALASLNEVLNGCGTGKEIAQVIDDLLFECLQGWCEQNQPVSDYHWGIIHTAKEIRSFFYSVE